MSFLSIFDNTKSGRDQAKHRNRLAKWQHFQNANKYANKTKAFKTGEEERVAGTQRNMANAHRKVLAIRGQVDKKKEEASKAEKSVKTEQKLENKPEKK